MAGEFKITAVKNLQRLDEGVGQIASLKDMIEVASVDVGAIAASAVLPTGTKGVRLKVLADCYITYDKDGSPGDPTINSIMMESGQTEYFGAETGGKFKVWDGVTV